jgi:hypothetical protein
MRFFAAVVVAVAVGCLLLADAAMPRTFVMSAGASVPSAITVGDNGRAATAVRSSPAAPSSAGVTTALATKASCTPAAEGEREFLDR